MILRVFSNLKDPVILWFKKENVFTGSIWEDRFHVVILPKHHLGWVLHLHRDLVRGWQDYRGRQGTETVWGPVLSALLFWVKASLETVHEPWLSELNCCSQWGNPKPDISELLRVSHSAFTALLHAKHLHIDKKLGINALNNPLTQECPYLSKWTGTSEI